MNNMDKLFYDMLFQGLVSTNSRWIQRAVQQKHPRLTIDLAHSILPVYSDLDKVVLKKQRLN